MNGLMIVHKMKSLVCRQIKQLTRILRTYLLPLSNRQITHLERQHNQSLFIQMFTLVDFLK